MARSQVKRTEQDGILSPEERARRIEQIQRCAVSRDKRIDASQRFRAWFEAGSDSGSQATYNKLFSHLRRISSFIFSPGTVRFGVHLPPSVRGPWLAAASVARDEFRQIWRQIGADLFMVQALRWALIEGCTITKIQPHPSYGFQLGFVQQQDFGVSREDVDDLEEQDTVCHWYNLSIPQVERWIHQERRSQDILTLAERHASVTGGARTRNRLVLSSITGTFPGGTIAGGFPGEPSTYAGMQAEVIEPTVEFVDLWERRLFRRTRGTKEEEIFEDWLVTTFIADQHIPVCQRRNPDLPDTPVSLSVTLPGELPFAKLTPHPIPDYFWGRSELDNLTNLQDWMNEYVGDFRHSMRKHMNPPKFFSGVAEEEEAGRAMDTPGGSYGAADPGAKMTPLVNDVGESVFKTLNVIGELFADLSGIPASITEPAQMPGGIRATGHFSMAAGIGAGVLREMALIIEESLGVVGTKGFHLMQRHCKDAFQTDAGQRFLLSQIPYGVSLSVDAHSAAPIFAEQTLSKAQMLLKAGAIGPEDFVELLDPPNRAELAEKAKVLAKNKAQMAQELLRIEEERAMHGKGSTKKLK